MSDERLPVELAGALPSVPEERRWLIEGLWSTEAVGVIGGEPKTMKTTAALSMAVTVAAGVPCFGRFAAAQTGRVLLYAAEDPPHVVRQRLEGLCEHVGVDLNALDLHVITTPVLRLDVPDERQRLANTIAELGILLLILDPFCRLHRGIDENQSSEVAPLLAFLRELQRRYKVAVALCHHSRKGAGKQRGGQALRGSSEFHAWVDSGWYLKRIDDERLALAVEHRSAPSMSGVRLLVRREGDRLLGLDANTSPTATSAGATPSPTTPVIASPADMVEAVLTTSATPLPLADLRRACGIRTAHVCEAVNALVGAGRVRKTPLGYEVVNRPDAPPAERFPAQLALGPAGSGNGKHTP
jgi:hypothetical protein